MKLLFFLLSLSLLIPVWGHGAFFEKQAAVENRHYRPAKRTPNQGALDNSNSQQPGGNKKLHKTDEVLVKFRPGSSPSKRNDIHKRHGSTRLKDFKKLNIHQIKLKKGLSVEDAMKLYQADPEVEFVEPNYLVSAAITPNDTFYGSSGSWGQSFQDMWGLHKMQLGSAWDVTQGSAEVVVAVSDTGLDFSHPDIQENIWTNPSETPYNGIDDDSNSFADDLHGWNFLAHSNNPADDNGHGTHVSGTIAATTNNGMGVAGISWHAKIMPLKFLDAAGLGDIADGIASIIYAADNGARVINCSWGSGSYSQALNDAIDYAFEKGVIVVAAAGNDSSYASQFFPGGCDNALTVAATDSSDLKASFSNLGLAVELAAPGVDILSLRAAGTDMYGDGSHVVGGSYYRASGTSMAAPHVSGLAALLISQHPTWSNIEILAQIIGTTDGIQDTTAGAGRINALSALTGTVSHPWLQLQNHTLTSLGGSNDGVLRPGESFNISVALRNLAAPGSATVSLTTEDPYVTVTNGTAIFSSIPTWTIVDNAATPFVVTVSPQAPVLHAVSFTVTITASNGRTSSASFQERVSPFLAGWPVNTGAGAYNDPVLADMDGDDIPEVIMFSDKVYVVKGDGTMVAGWPREHTDLGWWSELAVGDLNGDGAPELVANGLSGIYAWKADGTMMPGFPATAPVVPGGNSSGFLNVAVADIDGDGSDEIISAAYWLGKVYAWRADGTVQPGWPVSFLPAAGAWNNMLPAIGDIDGDGLPEIMVPASEENKVYAWHHDGAPVAGWPVSVADPPDAVVVGDMKGDGHYRIFVGTSNFKIHGFNGDGSSMPGWPQTGAEPAIGDLDGDGELEVVTDGLWKMHAYHSDGSELPGWPRDKISNAIKAPVLGDIDGDGSIEVVERTLWGIFAWHADGTPLADFPIEINPYFTLRADIAMALGDIKGDGQIALITGSGPGDSTIYAYKLPESSGQRRLPWPMQQRDSQRTGGMIRAPIIAASSFTGVPGTPFNQKLVARKGIPPYSWTITSGILPPGLTLNGSTGSIAGTPLQAGSFPFTVQVRDMSGAVSARALSMAIQPVAINTQTLPPAQSGTWYSQLLSPSGGTVPYVWSVINGRLPAGLVLDAAAGTIAGYPTARGIFSFTIRLADANGLKATRTLQIDVSEWGTQTDYRSGSSNAIAVDNTGNVYTSMQIWSSGTYLVKSGPTGTMLWNRQYTGDVTRDIFVDDLGNVYLAGFNNSPTPRAFAIKYDSSGNEIWTRHYDGYLYGMAVDSQGNLYMTGAPQVRNGSDAWLLKYDSAGVVVWSKPALTSDTPRGIAVDQANNVYVSCNGRRVMKFGPSGDPLWTRWYGSDTLLVSGIVADRDANIIVASVNGLHKYGPSGNKLWDVGHNGAAFSALTKDNDGNTYTTGTIWNGNDANMITRRYDASGNLAWTKTFDSGFADNGNGLAMDSNSNAVYVAGVTNSHPVTIRYDQPKITTAALPDAHANGPFSQLLAAERGTTPYSWSIVSGELPQGFSLNDSTGVISGKTSTAGSYSFCVKTTDANAISDLRTFSLTVNSTTPATDFQASPLTGQAPLVVSFTDASTNSPTDWAWTFGDGSSASAQNEVHTYTVPGTYTVSLTTTSSAGSETKTNVNYITVLACANAPVNLSSLDLASFTDVETAYAQASDNDLIMLQALDFSAGLNMNRNITVTLKGGYDCGYLDDQGAAVLGSLQVQHGTAIIERLVLK